MSEINGKVTMPKRAFEHDFLNRQAANPRSAWHDLWLWANDRPRTIAVGAGKSAGRSISLARGQLAYSQTTLAKLWRWDFEKTHRFLVELQNEGLITFDATNTTTIITVLDYPIYNPDTTPQPSAEPSAEPNTEGTAEPNTEGMVEGIQKGEGGRRKGEGARARDLPEVEIPDLKECRAWAELSGIDPDYIESQWRTTAGNDAWQTRSGRLIDWRNLWLGRWLQDRARFSAKKNGAKNGENPATEFTGKRERGEILQELAFARKSGAAERVAELEHELAHA